MKTLAGLIFSLAVIILLSSCSSKEVTKDDTPKKDSTYVFDQVPVDTVKPPPTGARVEIFNASGTQYTVQMGAFSTQEKADAFVSTAKKKLNRDMTIKFSNEKNLFVVQITPPFPNKIEADKERDNIKQFQEYKDAWTVTIK